MCTPGRRIISGRLLGTTGSLADTIGKANPFLYRGYSYDAETGLYYLNSRYYDPQTGRFLNADGQFNPETGLAGNNIFAYCNNRPVIMIDSEGTMMAMCDVGGGSYYSVPYTGSTKQKYIMSTEQRTIFREAW